MTDHQPQRPPGRQDQTRARARLRSCAPAHLRDAPRATSQDRRAIRRRAATVARPRTCASARLCSRASARPQPGAPDWAPPAGAGLPVALGRAASVGGGS